MEGRKRQILNAIIEDYVATAEPVGSRTISKKYDLGVSSATIRNEMSDLEDLGYIEQPHTSAGRIPSDKGYRYYVDCMMEKEELTDTEVQSVDSFFNRKLTELDQVVQQTCQLLSQLTNYTTLILIPKRGEGKLEKIQLIAVSSHRVMVVIITDTGFVSHRVMDLSQSYELEQLSAIGDFLQKKLYGLNLEQVDLTLLREISLQLGKQNQLKDLAFDMMEQALLESGEERVFLGGALNMLNQPEFRDIDKLKTLLETLEEEQIVRHLLKKQGREGTDISIGGENRYQGVNECSVITTTYLVDGKVVGSIGVLGPTRMVYPKSISLLEFVTDRLSKALTPRNHK